MGLEVTNPWWLLAGAVAFMWAVLWYRRSLVDFPRSQRAASLAVRSLVLAMLCLALARPAVLLRTTRQYVLLLVDVSRSIGARAADYARDFVRKVLEEAGDSEVGPVFFAAETGAVHSMWPENHDLPDDRLQATNIDTALRTTRALFPTGFVPRIVLLSDGRETEGNARQATTGLGIPVDVVPLPGRDEPELQVAAVHASLQVPPEEPFHVEVEISSNRAQPVTATLYRNGLKVADREIELKPGTETVRLRDRLSEEKQATYLVVVRGPEDTFLDNNRMEAVVHSRGKPKVMIVEQRVELGRHLARALQQNEMIGEVRTPDGVPEKLQDLQDFDAVVVSNVPATAFSTQQMETLRRYVTDLGGRLCDGGRRSGLWSGGLFPYPPRGDPARPLQHSPREGQTRDCHGTRHRQIRIDGGYQDRHGQASRCERYRDARPK